MTPLHPVPGEPKSAMRWEVPRDSGCHSKQSFRTRHDAARSIERLRRSIQRHFSRSLRQPYRCGPWGSWHIGASK